MSSQDRMAAVTEGPIHRAVRRMAVSSNSMESLHTTVFLGREIEVQEYTQGHTSDPENKAGIEAGLLTPGLGLSFCFL